MIKTYGLTHIAVAVKDIQRTSDFYREIFGAKEIYRSDDMVQLQTPGAHDAIVFERKERHPGEMDGISHFGFRLVDPGDISGALTAIEAAGGKIIEHGEFCPGEPYIFFHDPDGYMVEVWYER